MIDWWDVFTNALWIFGLAIVLAAFSYRGAWKKYQPRIGSMLWAEEIWPALGLAMFCFGLGLISDHSWKLVFWIFLGFVSLGMPWFTRLMDRKKKRAD